MKLDEVYILIEKYFDGKTSLAEEGKLRDFFSNAEQEYPEDLQAYATVFNSFTDSDDMHLDESYTEDIWNKIELEANSPKVIIKPMYVWLTMAAASLIFLISVFQNNTNRQDKQLFAVHNEKEMTEREAIMATKQALAFVSVKLNKGRKPLRKLGTFYSVQNIVKKR